MAKHQYADGKPGHEDGPQAERPEQGRGSRRQKMDAAADDVVDRDADQLPAADRTDQMRFIFHQAFPSGPDQLSQPVG